MWTVCVDDDPDDDGHPASGVSRTFSVTRGCVIYKYCVNRFRCRIDADRDDTVAVYFLIRDNKISMKLLYVQSDV